jgi:predicted NUDIX family NTP pyrophosphohydrolase
MRIAAGIIIYQKPDAKNNLETRFLLAHMGGPFWGRKEKGAWSIPKGEAKEGEDLIQIAKREFVEETGLPVPKDLIYVGQVKYKNGKVVHAFAGLDQDLPKQPQIKSNFINIQWPPKSGQTITIPEIDRAEFFTLKEAREKIIPAQFELLEKLSFLLTSNV